jgi:predicted Zn-dependent protease with MMP-like domain
MIASLPFLSKLRYGRSRLSGEDLLERASAAYIVGDHDAAGRWAHELADNPGDVGPRAQALTMLSAIERLEGSRERAATFIQEATTLAPNVFRGLCDDDPHEALAWRRLGNILTWTATVDAADYCFERAHELDPDLAVPFHVSDEEFAARSLREWDGIPAGIRAHLDQSGFQIRVAPFPSVAAIEAGQVPLLLGCCHYGTSTITLFQRLIEWQSPNAERLQRRIRAVVRHEVGHAVGMTEADVRDLGLH